MGDNLDDLDIGPPEEREPSFGSTEEGIRSGHGALVLAGLLILAAAAVGTWLLIRQPRKVAPIAATPPVVSAVPQELGAAQLPSLEESDTFVREIAATLSAHPEWARWLARTSLIRTLAAVVSNVANGETPRRNLEFLAPKQRFRAASGRKRIIADPASYAGYDLFADAIASIDARAAAAAYRALEPLFDAANRELGYPKPFRPTLDAAIRELLAVSPPPEDAELVPGAAGFRWADAHVEALSAAQKQFLRTGPRNVRLAQGKLRELQRALGSREPGR